MAGPYTMSVIEDVALNSVSNILRNQRGRTLQEASQVKIYANREDVDVSFNVLVGAESVLEDGVAAINATAGVGPIIPDDLLINTFGQAGDEIVVRARNVNAAAREARVTIFVTPVDDVALQKAMDSLA